MALDPGTLPPLPKVLVAPIPPPVDGLSNRFLLDPEAARPA